jgi:hypothetical protein
MPQPVRQEEQLMDRVSPSMQPARKQPAARATDRPAAPYQAPSRKAISREHQLRQLINDLADLAAKHRLPHQQKPAGA